jgi:anti-sigma B factor antagonist
MTSDSRQNGYHDPRRTSLECRTEITSNCFVIHVLGEVDLATVPILERALDSALASTYPIIVDFEATSYIDSTGLHVLLRARRRHAEILAAAAPAPTLRRVFELTHVDQAIPLYPTLRAAMRAICVASPPSEVAGS